MAKALCMTGLVVAGLIAILFAVDLFTGIPFHAAVPAMNIAILVSAILLGVISWFTLREQA